MKSDELLSDLYQEYTAGNLSRKEFEGRIFRYFLDNYERFRLFDGDRSEWRDFLSWLYPRLARAIGLYRDVGSSFGTYITSLVHGAAREYRFRETEHQITEYICWQARAEEMVAFESEPEYAESRKAVSLPKGIKARQILFLLLKSYFFVTDEFVERVARAIGMDVKTVQGMIDELRNRRSAKEEEILALRERVHSQHYRCLIYQKRMSAIQPGTDYYERLKRRSRRARKRFFAMKNRLGRMRTVPSNRLIAEIMGIPRGTVDSGLFSVKSRFSYLTKAT